MHVKPQCPECRESRTVYMVDKGLKRIRRMLAGDNRFACYTCKISWRRKTPFDCVELVKRKEGKR